MGRHQENRLRQMKADVVIPIPLHWWRRLRARLQADRSLIRSHCQATGVPHEPGWLRRIRPTRSQQNCPRPSGARYAGEHFASPECEGGGQGDLRSMMSLQPEQPEAKRHGLCKQERPSRCIWRSWRIARWPRLVGFRNDGSFLNIPAGSVVRHLSLPGDAMKMSNLR